MSHKESFTAFLLKNRLVSQEKLSHAVQSGGSDREGLAMELIRAGAMTEPEMISALSKYHAVPYVDSKLSVEPSLFHLLPEAVIRKYRAIPVRVNEKTLTVAMVDPGNFFSREYLQMVSGYFIESMGVLESDYNRMIEIYFSASTIDNLVKDMRIPEVEVLVGEAVDGQEDKPMARLVDSVVLHAVRLNASDIHIEPQDKDFLIRFRIDGMLRPIDVLPKHLHSHVVSRLKVLGGLNITERRIPQDGQIRLKVLERDIDIRVSSLPSRYGEKLVLRILDKTSFMIGLEQLGLSPSLQTRFEDVLNLSSGMFLVTGPTGSGKTTTLYSCINRMRSPMKNIITLEDPIEYELLAGKSREGGITQVQINPKVGLTFVEGLKSSLRQDPDVIFLGEIRDKESAEIAFTSALTGHFVLSSLHTIGAPATVTRLLDMGIEPFLMVTTLRAIVSQRLVRMLCPQCKEPYIPPRKSLEKLMPKSLSAQSVEFFRPRGCPWCAKTGYRGRTGIYEMMEITDKIRDLILSKAPNTRILLEARESGMTTLRQSGIDSVTRGITTIAEVMRVCPPA